jgi:hypothetical protein
MPSLFPAHTQPEPIDVAAVLNVIGILTTPPLSGGASLSELWAFVRYFFAITQDDDLRLTSDFQEMDPHQKTILSDDFGVGFSMHWLAQRLDLIAACDGRYFIENHLTSVGGTYTGGTAKRGLGKSPDFVGLDKTGLLHVIECKGTQSSLGYRNSQLRDTARIQKTTIQLPAHLAGEKLAAGIFIAGESGDATEMRIVDPDSPEKYVVRDQDPTVARNAVVRGTLAKQLRSAGFPSFAAAVAFPRPRPNLDVPGEMREDKTGVTNRRERAEAELREQKVRTFEADDHEFVGRRIRIDLPRPIRTKRGDYTVVEVRQGVERETFDNAKSSAIDQNVMDGGQAAKELGVYRFGERRGRAWMRLGAGFYSDIRFLR